MGKESSAQEEGEQLSSGLPEISVSSRMRALISQRNLSATDFVSLRDDFSWECLVPTKTEGEQTASPSQSRRHASSPEDKRAQELHVQGEVRKDRRGVLGEPQSHLFAELRGPVTGSR